MNTRRKREVHWVLLTTTLGFGLWSPPSGAKAWCQMTTDFSGAEPGACPPGGQPLQWNRACLSYAIDEKGSRTMTRETVETAVNKSISAWLNVTCNGTPTPLATAVNSPSDCRALCGTETVPLEDALGTPDNCIMVCDSTIMTLTQALDDPEGCEVECGGSPTDFQVQQMDEASRCDSPEFNPNAGNVNAISFVTDWEARHLDPEIFALTTVWHDVNTGEIRDVDMEVNEQHYTFEDCPAGGCTDENNIDLQNVLAHESGHFFGLGHTPTTILATMYGASPPAELRKRTLHPDDQDGFCSIYPPDSLDEACEFEPLGGVRLDCLEPEGSCGCSIPGARTKNAPWAIAWMLGVAALRLRRRSRAKPDFR